MSRAAPRWSWAGPRRIGGGAQTHALIARDHGCSFPGYDRAPEWCERHHIIEWVDGGTTDLDNLTLVCRYHHHNFAARGWKCRINPDRLPEWVPPRWIDRTQQPLINSRIIAHRDSPPQRRRARSTKRTGPATPTSPDTRRPQPTDRCGTNRPANRGRVDDRLLDRRSRGDRPPAGSTIAAWSSGLTRWLW